MNLSSLTASSLTKKVFADVNHRMIYQCTSVALVVFLDSFVLQVSALLKLCSSCN